MKPRRITNKLFMKMSINGTLRDIEFIHELGFMARIKVAPGRFSKTIQFQII
jgi:hypothetical protein